MNLLENIKWTAWSPRSELSPEFTIEVNKLSIKTGDNKYAYGKFLSGEVNISGAHSIVFETSFSCVGVDAVENSVFAMVSFYNAQKKMLERDYADVAPGGKLLRRRLDAPENSEYTVIELGARWCKGSSVEFSGMSLEIADAAPPKTAVVATTFKNRRDTLENNLEAILAVIDKAAEANPDVILLSELVYESCYSNELSLEETAQEIPGKLTGTIGEYAKKHNSYIIFTMNEKENGIIYNTAVIMGRGGEICGKYRKTHLPLSEAESGTSPGDSLQVFDLDFGRVGVIICYDQYFLENSRTLALMGAEIIFIPTMGEDELVQRAIARSNGVWVVVSGYAGAASSRIIDPLGETITCASGDDIAYAAATLDLNKRFFIYWMSIGDGNGEPRDLFVKERMTGVYGTLAEDSYKVK